MSREENGSVLRRLRQSYLAKMVALFLVIVVVVSGVGLFQQQMVGTMLEEDVRSEVQVVGDLQAEELSLWLESRGDDARMLSQYEVMTSDDRGTVDDFFEHERENLPEDVHTLALIDLESRTVVASPNHAIEGEPVSAIGIEAGDGSFEFADSDAVHHTEPYLIDGEEYIGFLSPVPDRPERAVLVVADLTLVAGHVFQSPFDSGFTQVVNDEGTVVLDERGESTLRAYAAPDSEALVAGRTGEHGVLERGAVDGLVEERHLTQYAPVNDGEWVLMLHVPTSEAYHVGDTVQTDILVLLGLFLTGLGAIGVVLHRYTVRPLTDLEGRVAALREGDLDVTVESALHDEIGRLFDGVDAMRRTIKERIETAEAATEEAQAATREAEGAKADAEAAKQQAEAMGEHLERKATEFGTAMAACAGGDLTRRLDTASESAAMTDVAESFNTMMDEIERTIVRVQDFSEDVAAMSQQVTVSVEEIRDASEEVSKSVVHIADGASDQNDRLLELTDEMNDLSAAVEEVAASTDELSGLAESAAADGQAGSQAAGEARRGMDRIEAETGDVGSEIADLTGRLDRISDIVEVITDIAEQTNILALNANIEAARAGEAGEGFAVVAAEVKSLAEETQGSVGEIESIIEDVTAQREVVLGGMATMREQVQEGAAAVDEAIGALDDISGKVADTDVGVREIDRATDDQADSAEGVLATADRVAEISEDTSAEAQQVSAAAQQQASAVAEVSDGVEHLAARTDELESLLDDFEVRTSAGDTAGASGTTRAGRIGSGASGVVTDGGGVGRDKS